MSFVSYAQNFEDVMLWRALKHIEKGFYVDVGAQHPVIDSVSKAFYERGWRGIHIEPVPQYAELLRKDRPDETVLQVALGDTEGTLELNVIPDTGLSTFVDAYAQRHKVEGGYKHHRIHVPVLTLKSVLRSLAAKDVHWLKIDVEGFEEKVLKGWDSQTLRPWIIVIEATAPLAPETNYVDWDPILIAADYQFVYFDGLNCFYVSKEHAELAEAFSCPPNFFDDMVLSASSYLCRDLIVSRQASEKELATQVEKLATEVSAANEHISRLQAHAEWQQKEWDAAKRRVEELSQRTGRLEGDLEAERQRTVQLGADLQAAGARVRQLQAHAEWLQREWDAAKGELRAVYASKSWRITWPLRKTMQGIKWLLGLPILWQAKRPSDYACIAKPLVVWAMRKTLSNPRLKSRALRVLAQHPQLKQHLRQFVVRLGLMTDSGIASQNTHPFKPDSGLENTVAIAYPPNVQGKSVNNLSPRAARIYADLQKAIEAREN